MGLHRSIIAYGVSCCGINLQYSIFYFYYVKVFVNIYKIEEEWFHYSQLMYLVFNFINVPVSSYIQDYSSLRCTRTRRENFLYSAPLLTISFLVPWLIRGHTSWSIGVHLIVSLVLWDSVSTYIWLGIGCLFAEISDDPQDRLKLTLYGNVGSLVGKSGVAIIEYTSNSMENYYYFQLIVGAIGLVSWLLFTYVGLCADTQYDCKHDTANLICQNQMTSFWRLIWEVLTQRDFQVFTAVNFWQEFHATFQNSLTVVLCDELVSSDDVPVWIRSFFYGALPIIPMVIVILFTSHIGQIGYYELTRMSFICKMFGSIAMVIVGRHHPWAIMLFVVFDQCITKACYALFNIPLGDVIDKDQSLYNRGHPISSLVYGTNTVIIKAATAFAPMMVVAILNHFGYEALVNKRLATSKYPALHNAMFYVLCGIPFVMGLVQLLTWSMYSMKENKTRTQQPIVKELTI